MRIKTKENMNMEILELRKYNYELYSKLKKLQYYIENHVVVDYNKRLNKQVLKFDKYVNPEVMIDILGGQKWN